MGPLILTKNVCFSAKTPKEDSFIRLKTFLADSLLFSRDSVKKYYRLFYALRLETMNTVKLLSPLSHCI